MEFEIVESERRASQRRSIAIGCGDPLMTNRVLGVFGAALDWLFEEVERGPPLQFREPIAIRQDCELLDVVETHHRVATNAAPVFAFCNHSAYPSRFRALLSSRRILSNS